MLLNYQERTISTIPRTKYFQLLGSHCEGVLNRQKTQTHCLCKCLHIFTNKLRPRPKAKLQIMVESELGLDYPVSQKCYSIKLLGVLTNMGKPTSRILRSSCTGAQRGKSAWPSITRMCQLCCPSVWHLTDKKTWKGTQKHCSSLFFYCSIYFYFAEGSVGRHPKPLFTDHDVSCSAGPSQTSPLG